jgi:NTE family protein
VDAGRAPSGQWAQTVPGPTGVDLIMATSDTATESGAMGSYSAFDAIMADWRKALVNWRCGLPEAERHRYGAPPGWNCRDLEFFISKISFDQLGPERAAALNKVETRFKLPPDQVDLLVTAGRDALNANSKFRGFLTSFGRAPPPPAAPGVPVATSDASEQQAAAEQTEELLRRRLAMPEPAIERRQ